MNEELKEIIDYYAGKSRRCDQNELISILREAQDLCGGILREDILEAICGELSLKRTYVDTVMKFIPDLKTEKVKHRLEVCMGKTCRSKDRENLCAYIEKEYDVEPGKVSTRGAFLYKGGGCMKNCKNGPCLKWDGELYTEMTPAKTEKLIKG